MAHATTIQTNFTSGELSPHLFGRLDVEKYAGGAANIFNFTVKPQGGITRRPGTHFVYEVLDQDKQARLVPFEFSTIQTYLLEFGDQYIRVFKDGGIVEASPGVPLEIATTYTETEVQELYFTQSADVLYICHPAHRTAKLSRTSHIAWTLTDLVTTDGPYMSNNDLETTITVSNIVDRETIVSSAADFVVGDVGKYVEYNIEGKPTIGVITAYVNANTVTIEPKQNVIAPLSEEVTIVSNTAGTVTASHGVFVRSNVGSYLRVNVVGTSTVTWHLVSGYDGTTRTKVTVGSALTLVTTSGVLVNQDRLITCTLTSSENLFTSTDVDRHVRLNFSTDQVWGTITAYTSEKVVAVTLNSPVPLKSLDPTKLKDDGQTKDYKLGAWSETTGWPRCCTFHEERLVFANSSTEPQTLWMSRSSDYENFSPTEPDSQVQDDNALTYTIASNKVNAILWLESAQALLLGTIGSEWQVRSSSVSDPITPSNITITQQTSYGSAENVPPVRIGNTMLFIQRSGTKLREMSYSQDADSFEATDVSVISEHILRDGLGARWMAYQQEPSNTIWIVMNSGYLAGITYLKEQDVIAWHQHGISGGFDKEYAFVESAASIPSTNGYTTYLIVKRTMSGITTRYIEYIEKDFNPLSVTDKDELFFVDSLLTYNGPASTTFAGLEHLANEIVSVVADGSALPPQLISVTGVLTLEKPASNVVVGLPYASILKTLPLEGATDSNTGPAQGRIKRIDRLGIRLMESIGLRHGLSLSSLTTLSFRTSQGAMDQSPVLTSKDFEVLLDDTYNLQSQYYIAQVDPYPLTILALMPRFRTAN